MQKKRARDMQALFFSFSVAAVLILAQAPITLTNGIDGDPCQTARSVEQIMAISD
jgi:hypothetical protein